MKRSLIPRGKGRPPDLEGGIYGGPPAPVLAGLDHCPLTNLLGENVFGDLDYDIGRRRNTSMHQRTSTNMITHNKTAEWLNNKEQTEAGHLLAFARKMGKSLRSRQRQIEKDVMLRLRQKLMENKAKKIAKEAKNAAAKHELLQRIAAAGGPCTSPECVDRLVARLRRESRTALLNALKDQVRYQKTILNIKGHLRLTGNIDDLVSTMKDHLRSTGPHLMPAEIESEGDDEDSQPVNFEFERQGQWVAVYYDNTFYVGQVTDILSRQKAMVKYMERCDSTGGLFRWPKNDDEAETESVYVFKWDMEVVPQSSDMRQWQVLDIDDIVRLYESLK